MKFSSIVAIVLYLSAMLYTGAANGSTYRVPPEASVISIEAESGLVLFEHNADQVRPPASMIKLMLMLMTVEGIDAGDWGLDTEITATQHAQRMGGTQVYLAAGEVQPLWRLMEAVAVASANDAAMAVAEGLWGSEAAYMKAMNERAQELGMTNTLFHSVHGLPPSRGEEPDKTTARDMVLLARVCARHPQLLAWSSMTRTEFRPGKTPFPSTNKLLRQMDNCDGLKTGYIRAAGFCLTATAHADGKRVITVIMGHPESNPRFSLAKQLLSDGLEAVEVRTIAEAGVAESLLVEVEGGTAPHATLALRDTLRIPTTETYWPQVEVIYDYPKRLAAPVEKERAVGHAVVRIGEQELARTELYVADGVDEATWSWRVRKGLERIVGGGDE